MTGFPGENGREARTPRPNSFERRVALPSVVEAGRPSRKLKDHPMLNTFLGLFRESLKRQTLKGVFEGVSEIIANRSDESGDARLTCSWVKDGLKRKIHFGVGLRPTQDTRIGISVVASKGDRFQHMLLLNGSRSWYSDEKVGEKLDEGIRVLSQWTEIDLKRRHTSLPNRPD